MTNPTPENKIVTRFAPSPTGNLHIGGVRTALFNWAFARRHGGTFVLRIEDTDKKRSTPESTRNIMEDLRWLGLDWDEGPRLEPGNDHHDPYSDQIGDNGPYFQSQRLDLYNDHIQKLRDSGRAYKCFKTPEELKADRDKAKSEKRPYKYDGAESRGLPPEVIKQYDDEKRPCVIRFAMPEHDLTVHDLVLGDVTVKATELEDFIIQKSDGYPTFHLANVVDDTLMGVTHVLRAQEHLMNTPKHVALQEALGLATPHYAHMPLIFNADGSKMSKRDKAKVARQAAKDWLKGHEDSTSVLATKTKVSEDRLAAFIDKKNDDMDIVEALAAPTALNLTLPEIDVLDFCKSGYLSEVLLNYLSLLGWSPGNDLERFDLDYLKANFNLERIGKSNARFDRAKLLAFNTEAIAKLSPDEFHQLATQHDQQFYGGVYKQQLGDDHFRVFADAYRERSRTLDEPFTNGRFFVQDFDEVTYDEKAVKKVLIKNDGEGLKVLADLRLLLEACESWTSASLEQIAKDYAEQHSLGLGKVAQPLRVAVSGSTVSPPIYDTLVILGKDSTLARIDRCQTQAATAKLTQTNSTASG